MTVILESFRSALRAVWRHKLRSGLTILSVVIGVLTIAGLLALALGVRDQVTREIEALGSTTVVVVPGRVRTASGGLNPVATIGTSTLTERDFVGLQRELPNVQRAAMGLLISGTVRAGAHVAPNVLIFAASPDLPSLLHLEVASGRSLSAGDETARARVVLLGAEPARTLFPGGGAVGRVLEIRGETLAVVGVLRERDSAQALFGPSFNDVVFLPVATGFELTGTRQVFRIILEATDAGAVEEVQRQVTEILRRNHGGEEDFSVLTQEEILGIVGNILGLLTRMVAAIASISLIIGGINIMSIMLVAVAERTKEIGIRKAVGATRLHILAQFLSEALVLSLGGGLLGVGLARGGVAIAVRATELPLRLTLPVVLLALSFSALVGIVFGLAPALRAARKDPVEALRSE